jgi:hypothetical protein
MTPELINIMWDSATAIDPQAFFSKSLRYILPREFSSVYQYFAHYVRLQALQQQPSRAHPEKNFLRNQFQRNQAHFKELYPDSSPTGLSALMLLHSKLLLCKETETYLSARFQSAVAHLGQALAGDEKLFDFSGDGWQRIKHDKIGIWSYEACGQMNTGLPYLVDVYSHTVDSGLGESVPTVSVLKRWGEVIQRLSNRSNTILVADSYYLDQVSFMALRDMEVDYICALQACRFDFLAKKARENAKKPGKTALLYNADHTETFCHHWYADSRLGRKYVMSNCLVPQFGSTSRKWIPGCDDFAIFFNYCDHFNNGLVEKTFPHRSASCAHALRDFLFSCVLLQVYYVYLTLNKLNREEVPYTDVMLTLADQLYEYSFIM